MERAETRLEFRENRVDFKGDGLLLSDSDKAVEKLLSRKLYLLLAGLKRVYNFQYHGSHCLYRPGTHVHFSSHQ